jgi:hypothetical protein
MGGSSVACNQHLLSDEPFTTTCYDGVLNTTAAVYGIMSTGLDKQIYCQDKSIWNVTANKNKANCTVAMD